VVRVYEVTGVKKAAAAAARRSLNRVLEWEQEAPEFRADMLSAETRFLLKNRHKVKLANVFAHLFDEYKPPKQEIEADLTINDVRNPDDANRVLDAAGLVRAPRPGDTGAE
jgi:hypothetical protein